MPCPGRGPLGGAQAGQKEMVLLVKPKPSRHWLDKVWQQERGLGSRKKSRKQPVPLLPHLPTSQSMSWRLWSFLTLVPLSEWPSSLCLSG